MPLGDCARSAVTRAPGRVSGRSASSNCTFGDGDSALARISAVWNVRVSGLVSRWSTDRHHPGQSAGRPLPLAGAVMAQRPLLVVGPRGAAFLGNRMAYQQQLQFSGHELPFDDAPR